MLIQLLPQQFVKFWDLLRYAIAESFMPRNSCTNEHLRHMLASLLSGRSQCWGAFDSERKFIGFVITRIVVEAGIGEKVLTFDTLYAFQPLPDEIFISCWRTLEEFAAKNGCKAVVGLTENPRLVSMVGKLGFSSRTYIVKEV